MEDIIFNYIERPELEDPIFIEGLPGVGNVGKLAAEHLIDELGAKKFAEIYSKHFPPQVLVGDKGVIRLVSNDLYYHKGKRTRDLIFLVGDYQGLSPEGQYELSHRVLEEITAMNVHEVFTLGGYGLGKLIEKPRVLGAATSDTLVERMKECGVHFPKGEPGSGIVGASGLLLGLGRLRGMDCVCLMGETSGYFVDPKSAQAVLEILTKIVGVEVDFSKLEDKAEQLDQITSKLKEIDTSVTEKKGKQDDMDYIV